MHYPQLEFTSLSLEEVVASFAGSGLLLVTDPFNYSMVKKYGDTLLVENNFHAASLVNLPINDLKGVIAIGGCSALDVGRAYAEDRDFIAIPTILSTSCISVNISILRSKDTTRVIKTVIPDWTIISLPFFLSQDSETLQKWSASGFGDLFANISAAVDYEFRNGSVDFTSIRANAREAFEALEWVIECFSGYNEETLRRLAGHLHVSSLDVINRGKTDLSAGCEHEFYEIIIRRQNYINRIQTHGILVGIGTLIVVGIYDKLNPGINMLQSLRKAFLSIGLPASYSEMETARINREHVMDALFHLKPGKSIMHTHFEKFGHQIVDEVFG